jgi:hypothetical protein
MTKRKGEVKISVKGNPFAYNPENQWNFGVYKTDNMSVDLGIKEILELLKRLRKG